MYTKESNAQFDKERVMERIAKMLRLANDAAASEGERDNAIRMAHATLAKYNLTLAEIDEKTQNKTEKRIDAGVEGRDFPWALRTAQSVANLFFCYYFYSRLGPGKVKHYFIGRQSNVETAREMAKFVINSIMSEGTRRSRNISDQPGKWQRNFCKGASMKVYERCLAIRKEAEKEYDGGAGAKATTGTALVLASFYEQEERANSEYLKDVLKINLKTGRSTERGAGAGYSEGKEFGASVSLNKQVGSNGRNGKAIAK